jgi:hypothetical protein
VRLALECYLDNRDKGTDTLHLLNAPRIRIS